MVEIKYAPDGNSLPANRRGQGMVPSHNGSHKPVYPIPMECASQPNLFDSFDGDVTLAGEPSLMEHRPDLPVLYSWDELYANQPEISWLWKDWLPNGFVTMFAGAPDAGKSALALSIGASIATGKPLPDGSMPTRSGKVLWVETEAANIVNVSRIREWFGNDAMHGFVSPTHDPFAELALDRQTDRNQIFELAADSRVQLIIIDSLSGSHSQDETNSLSGKIVKELAKIARDHNKALLITHHLRKARVGEGDEVTLDRVRGSTALVQYARMVWAVDVPNLATRHLRRLSVIKSNLGSFPPPIGVTIDDTGVAFTPDAPVRAQRASELVKATDFLLTRLADGHEVSSAEIENEAAKLGIAIRTLDRARKEIGIERKRVDGHWVIKLPITL